MAAHAPYIMPDGRSLQTYLHQEREREQLRRRKAELRGKDLQFAQLLRQRGAASSELELAELKAMESAGVRRRRRWINDKTLRDLAGPLSAADMEAQFKPAPFGNPAAPSALSQAMAPANAALWENFRNIDPEKEARVLQKWAAHQRESAPLRQRPHSQASLALHRWAAVGKKARAALKRANAASVMALELQILDFFETAGPGEQLVLPLEDGFARLLVHGLAEFYGLLSVSRPDPSTNTNNSTGASASGGAGGNTCVAVYRRSRPAAGESELGGGSGPGLDISLPLGRAAAQPVGAGVGPSPGRRAAGGTASTGPSPARGALAGASPVRGSGAAAAAVPAGSPAVGAAASPAPTALGTPAVAGAQQAGGAAQGLSPSPSPSPGRRLPGAGGVSGSSPPPGARGAGRSTSTGPGAGGGGGGASESPAAAAAGAVVDHEITCADVLMAMAEVGQMGLNEETLRRYVATHIHGTLAAEGRQEQQQQRPRSQSQQRRSQPRGRVES
ncbi:hypothetical protein CHLRE_01g040100v5 [Chlamydomonas reinhardtii]|uniref:R3H-associated N-terminal domain-containing protein n=1 Tax=Chlamydomonas reinhardtii TaxID=3055 RepID=A0A2K3E7B4_CHLRE|nr:uncharacterized protein CHLRE_01g040100v5 [Chlamydomonas reinhardtii]PNW88679.1 hypothetical protein CHLRE_01g040100v5 [Chlamydomonas reinhardtii]